ncbi:MAG: ABC transporter permease [Candidatus Hodarchaeales archaeon]|jgi:ABC-type polysaccharide/polyol phosphate export permease
MKELEIPKSNSFWAQYRNITKKEVKIQMRYPIAFFSAFIQNFLIILIFTFVAKLFVGTPGSEDGTSRVTQDLLSTYMVLGLMTYLFFGSALRSLGMSLRNEQNTGTLETMFLYPIDHLANLLAKTTWTSFLNFFVTIFGAIVLSFLSGSILFVFPNFIYGFFLFLLYLLQIYGFAFFLAGLNLRLKESIEPLTNFIQFFLLIISAIFFPFSALGPIVIVSYFIPFSYIIDLVRTTTLNTPPELATIAMNNLGLGNEVIVIQWLLVLIFTILLPILGYKYFIKTINDSRFAGTISDY